MGTQLSHRVGRPIAERGQTSARAEDPTDGRISPSHSPIGSSDKNGHKGADVMAGGCLMFDRYSIDAIERAADRIQCLLDHPSRGKGRGTRARQASSRMLVNVARVVVAAVRKTPMIRGEA